MQRITSELNKLIIISSLKIQPSVIDYNNKFKQNQSEPYNMKAINEDSQNREWVINIWMNLSTFQTRILPGMILIVKSENAKKHSSVEIKTERHQQL